MTDKGKAYEIMSLHEGSSKDEISKKYSVHLKRYRQGKIDRSAIGVSDERMDEITNAYNLLMGYQDGEAAFKEEPLKPNLLLDKMGIDRKKTRNFFHYYKVHIIIGIIVLIVLATIIRGCVTRVDPDINVAFIGNIYYGDSEEMGKVLTAAVPSIKSPSFDGAMISDNTDVQQGYALQMKIMILLAAADVDIFIIDKSNYLKFAKQGAFDNLDTFISNNGIDAEGFSDLKVSIEDNNEGSEANLEKHFYGIDITKSKLLKELGVTGENMIVTLSIRLKHFSNSIELLKALTIEK